MRRKVTSFMLALLLTAAVPFTASAETVKSDKEMDVKFDGNKIESTFSTKDIDFTASSMQPRSKDIFAQGQDKTFPVRDWEGFLMEWIDFMMACLKIRGLF